MIQINNSININNNNNNTQLLYTNKNKLSILSSSSKIKSTHQKILKNHNNPSSILSIIHKTRMQHKQYQKSMLVYRGRKKNTNNNNNSSRYESNLDNKTQNLKSIHRTLVQKSKNQLTTNNKQQQNQQSSLLQQIQQKSLKQQQQSTKKSHNTNSNYGSMYQLNNPYLTKSESRQHHHTSLYRSSNGKAQSNQHRKLRQSQNTNNNRSKHNMSVQSLLQNEKAKRKMQQKQKIKYQRLTIQRHDKKQQPHLIHQQSSSTAQQQKSVNFYINIQKLRNLKITSRQKLHIPSTNNDLSTISKQVNMMRQSNGYLMNKKNNINSSSNNNISINTDKHIDKRSLILKPPSSSQNSNINKQHNRSLNAMSMQKIQSNNTNNNSSFKFLMNNNNNNNSNSKRPHPNIKPRLRYKTHQNQQDDDNSQDYSIGMEEKNGNKHVNRVKSLASQHNMQHNNQNNNNNRKSNFRNPNQNNKNQFRDKSFIQGYLKGKQLGRGGFSKVWQGFHFTSKHFYAIKQIDTTNKYQTHLTEIWFGNHFFQSGGKIKQIHAEHAGAQKLLRMFQYSIIDPKAFIVYQSCDGSLGNMLYDIYQQQQLSSQIQNHQEDKNTNEDDNKLYMIKYKHLYSQLRKNSNFIKHFIKSIAQALDLLAINKIVHSDIKTENILLKKLQHEKKYQFKLIDYGSSFVFQSLKQYKLATPEYMCPQLLNYILFQNKKPCYQWMLEYVKKYQNISAIDVWGLGCIVIQLIHGLPLWLNNPTRIFIRGKYETKKGLFAVNDRSFSKILQKQLAITNDFDQFIINQNNSDICIDKEVRDVLKAMLNPNPKHRIKPHQIVSRLSSSMTNSTL